jgi:hypothetical protein
MSRLFTKPDWWTGTVRAICVGILEDKAFDRMPVLADALEDAGFGNGFFIDVLRGRTRGVVTEKYADDQGPYWRPIRPQFRTPRTIRTFLTEAEYADGILRGWINLYGC